MERIKLGICAWSTDILHTPGPVVAGMRMVTHSLYSLETLIVQNGTNASKAMRKPGGLEYGKLHTLVTSLFMKRWEPWADLQFLLW